VADIPQDSRFYFVHSYYVPWKTHSLMVAGTHEYGLDFAAALAATTCLPCSSTRKRAISAGLQLLANFVAWNGRALECAC
jgi:glutamine amidotransferase